MNKIKQIEDFVIRETNTQNGHDFKHANQVRKLAIAIAQSEKYSRLDLVEAASLMHDIGISKKKNRRDHGYLGAMKARKFLSTHNLFQAAEIDEICQAILHHNHNRKGEGKLLDILRDADILELLGARGIMRALVSSPNREDFDQNNIKGETWNFSAQDFNHRFDNNLEIGKTLVDEINFEISCFDTLKSKYAKKLAHPLIKFMRGFILQLEKELLFNKNN